jgi:medium-chain acyl-[acyl-carrier-protein] hydrolase
MVLQQAATVNRWLPYCPERSASRLRLLCLPYAGGAAAVFRPWRAAFAGSIEVCPVELPGRGVRVGEPCVGRLVPLAKALAQGVAPHLDGGPFAIFGHSMGALLAFELARELRRHGLLAAQLLVAGRSAPHIPEPRLDTHQLPDREFLDHLRRLNGTPPGVLEHEELMQILLPMLRADFAVSETYVFEEEPPLSCPIGVLGGHDDPDTSPAELEAWRRHTSGPCRVRMFAGDHFFLHALQDQVVEALREELLPAEPLP